VPAQEAFEVRLRCGDTDLIGNVDGEEVAGFEEAVYCLEMDVVGITEVRVLPLELMDSGVGSGARLRRFGADDGVLAIGFVPHRQHMDSGIGSLDAGPELGACLMGKAVSHADRKPAE
jgi:hypothetical protein